MVYKRWILNPLSRVGLPAEAKGDDDDSDGGEDDSDYEEDDDSNGQSSGCDFISGLTLVIQLKSFIATTIQRKRTITPTLMVRLLFSA